MQKKTSKGWAVDEAYIQRSIAKSYLFSPSIIGV